MNVSAVLVEVRAEESERAMLSGMGIAEGAPLILLRRAPFGGPVQVRVGEVTYALDRSLAAMLRVELEAVEADPSP